MCEHHGHEHGEEACWYRGGAFIQELSCHFPFSILSVTLGLILAGLICFFVSEDRLTAAEQSLGLSSTSHQHDEHNHDHAHGHEGDAHSHQHSGFIVLFHLFHPAHMLFSAAATSAMFWRYDRNRLKGMLVGFSGAVLVCGVSDVLLPHLSALIMGQQLDLHICIIEHPMLVIPFAAIGVLVGMAALSQASMRNTLFSHSGHVFISTMASIFYLISSFGQLEWINRLGAVFFFICVAVMIPCCLSDIVYPLFFTKEARDQFLKTGHVH